MANLYGDLRIKKVIASGDISTTRDALISGTLYVSGHSLQPIGPGVLLVDGVVVSGSAGGGGSGSGIVFFNASGLHYVHTQTTAATTWTVTHNANSTDYNISLFDSSGSFYIPNQINTINANTIQIVNSVSSTGKAVLQFGFVQSEAVSGTIYVHNQSTLDTVWTITHNQNTRNFLIQTFGPSGELFIPEDIRPVNANQIAVSHVTAQSGSAVIVFSTSNFDATQQSQYVHTQSSPAVTWSIVHNLGTKNFDITLFDASGHVFWPDDIFAETINKVVVTNAYAKAGTAVLVFQNAGVQAVPQSQYVFTQGTPATTWTINHAQNSTHFNVDFYDLSGNLFVPTNVQYSGMNFVIATNSTAKAGTAVFTFKNSAVALFHENAPYEQRFSITSGSVTSGLVLNRFLPLTFYNSADRGKVYQVSIDGTGPMSLDTNNTAADNDYREVPVAGTDLFNTFAFNEPITGPANIIVWAPGIVDGSSYSVQQIASLQSDMIDVQSGDINFRQPPKVDLGGVSFMFRNNGVLNGSTNNNVVRYVSLVEQSGNDITYNPSTASGDSFIINTKGIYSISASSRAASGNGTFQLYVSGIIAPHNSGDHIGVRAHASYDAATSSNRASIAWTGLINVSGLIWINRSAAVVSDIAHLDEITITGPLLRL